MKGSKTQKEKVSVQCFFEASEGAPSPDAIIYESFGNFIKAEIGGRHKYAP